MIKTIVLICSASLSPSACTEITALDVIRAAPVRNAVMCGFFGQAGIATTKVAPGPGEYAKIVCERQHEAAR